MELSYRQGDSLPHGTNQCVEQIIITNLASRLVVKRNEGFVVSVL